MGKIALVLAIALVVSGAAYCLQHGIYVGKSTYDPGNGYTCRYLFASGVVDIGPGMFVRDYCPLFSPR